VRAERPTSREALVTYLDTLFTDRVLEGALSNSDLTFKELEIVKQTFIHILQGVHHPRIRYPEQRGSVTLDSDNGSNGEGNGGSDLGGGPSGGPGGDQIVPPTTGWGNFGSEAGQTGADSLIYSFTGSSHSSSGRYRGGEI